MSLLDYLKENFGVNEPILFNEIKFKNYSKPWLKKDLNKLCKFKQIIRFDKGIYYVPTKNDLGLSTLDPYKVIEKKYIKNNESTFGYYSGRCFMNQMGLSTQVPSVIEIYTNNEKSKKRTVKVGWLKVIIRRSRTLINSQNVATLCLMELLNIINVAELNKKENIEIIKTYIKTNNITISNIKNYVDIFPSLVSKKIIEFNSLILS